ncbi:MAG: ATP-binding protein [Gammaproteobacteria bacterium]|nr:ATP-binding protein [Gammaproteobacteria bacterium]
MATIQIKAKTTKRIIFSLIFLSVGSLLALMFAADNPNELNRMQSSLLVVNILSFVVFFIIVVLSAKNLLNDYRKNKLGAKLRLRMSLAFGGLAVIPAVVLFFFAINFMNKGISVWSDADVEQGLNNALMLGRSALDEKIQQGLFETTNIALQLQGIENIDLQLRDLVQKSKAEQLVILDSDIQVLASGSDQINRVSTRIPTLLEIEQANLKQSWTSLDSSPDGSYLIRVLVPVLSFSSNQKPLYLQAFFSVDPKLSMMADSVEETYARYGRLSFMKDPIQYSYILTLAIVVLLALLLAIYGSIEFADRLVKPIESLEKEAESMIMSPRFADDNDSSDEITTLVNSFMRAQKEAAWSDVARRMAHEINNPLTPIQLSAERIKKRFSASKGEDLNFITASTDTIVNQVEVLREMVNAFGKFAEQPKLKTERINIPKIIDEAIGLYSKDHKAIKFSTKYTDKAFIHGDEKKLRQILNNLLKNSIDALSDIEKPRITVATRDIQISNTAFLELSIEDNGIGFTEETVSKVFEPYVSTKPKGKGLGLAIVKNIVDEHQGHIAIKNNQKGASVIITIPVNQPPNKNL